MAIEASNCGKCNRTIVPPRRICPYCSLSAEEMHPVQLNNHGVVLSYTVLETAPAGFEPPLLLALVQLDEKAVILGLAETKDIETLEIDSEVEVRQDEDGRFLVSTRST